MRYARFSFSLLVIYAVVVHAANDRLPSSMGGRSMPSAVTILRALIYNNVCPKDEQICVDELTIMSSQYGPTELFSPYYTALYYAYRLHLNPPVNSEMNKVLASRGRHIHLHNLTGELMRYQKHLWWADLVKLKRQMDIRESSAAEKYLDMIGNRIDDLQKQFHAIKTIEQLSQSEGNIWESLVQMPPTVECEEGPVCFYQDIKRAAYAMENVPYPYHEEEGEFVYEAAVQKETISNTPQ